jgi:hypothetical protein
MENLDRLRVSSLRFELRVKYNKYKLNALCLKLFCHKYLNMRIFVYCGFVFFLQTHLISRVPGI